MEDYFSVYFARGGWTRFMDLGRWSGNSCDSSYREIVISRWISFFENWWVVSQFWNYVSRDPWSSSSILTVFFFFLLFRKCHWSGNSQCVLTQPFLLNLILSMNHIRGRVNLVYLVYDKGQPTQSAHKLHPPTWSSFPRNFVKCLLQH